MKNNIKVLYMNIRVCTDHVYMLVLVMAVHLNSTHV